MALKIAKPEKSAKRFSISLRWLMISGFGGLVLISVGLVLFISVSTNFANTFSLLNDRAVSLLDNMERSIRLETDQAERTLLAVAKLYNKDQLAVGPLDKNTRASQQAVLQGMLIASPIVEGLLFYDLNGWQTGVFRTPDGRFRPLRPQLYDAEIFSVLKSHDEPEKVKHPVWGEPTKFDGVLYHTVGFPLKKQGKISGYVFATIGQHTLSRIVTELGQANDTTVYILTSDNKVIGHSRMPGFFKENGIVSLKDFPDRSLRQLATARIVEHFDTSRNYDMEIRESGKGSGHIFITRELAGYSNVPYHLGAYFKKADFGNEILRAFTSALAGLLALVIAVLASIFLARRLSQPMLRISKVANDFSNLKLNEFTHLPRSRIREIDEQSMAMNSMHTTLSEFTQYVPRSLVKRLMKPGSSAIRSVEREITILFADIASFTSLTEDLNAIDTATLLNSHFDNICNEITKHKGTVDKFIGDGVMAFWGAPGADDEQAKNALEAARDMVIAVNAQNKLRKAASVPPLRLRIGIHTGRVVVGNIGCKERQNYTLVGDAVNVANRLEQYGKLYIGDADTIVITSATTWEAAGKPEYMHSIGHQKLRGREAMIQIFAMGDNISKDTRINQETVSQSN